MRVKWNRQLDGSLARRQAEEEAAAAAAQLNKDKPRPEVKHKSSPKIFRLFRRKKRNRLADDEPNCSPETSFCTPSEADDEDCASISSVATVASQPVSEVCHRDRTTSLFSSFRLNFPRGRKKSKLGTLPPAAPLFHEKEPENNRYSSPDLMREKLEAARSQTELSKSSPSVRNAKDPAAATPGDFQSLGELRTENSTSFQQLKHASAKDAQGDAKLAKSVSFSDCQVSLSSKQMPCANARLFQTSDGQTERKTKSSRRKFLYHSTETEGTTCESKSTSNDADSLSLPTQPLISNHSADSSKDRTEGAMNGIVSSKSRRVQTGEEVLRNRFEVAHVRGQWLNDIQGTDRNGNVFELHAAGSRNNHVSDKSIVISKGKSAVSCNGPVSLNDLCSVESSNKINTTHSTVQMPTELSNAVNSKSCHLPSEQFSIDRGCDIIYNNQTSCYPSNSINSINCPVVDNSLCGDSKSDIVPFSISASGEQLSGRNSASYSGVNNNNAVPFITGTPSESLNITDSSYRDVPLTLAEGKLPIDIRKVDELSILETNGTQCDSFPSNRELRYQKLAQNKNDIRGSGPKVKHAKEFEVTKLDGLNANMLQSFEKRNSNGLLHDFELSTSKNYICNDSSNICQPHEVFVSSDNQIVLSDCDSASSNSCSTSELSSGDKELNLNHYSEISLPHTSSDIIDNMSNSLTYVELLPSLMTDSAVELDVLSENIVSNNSAISSSSSQFLTHLKSHCNNITRDSILQLNFLNWLQDDSDFLYALCSSCSRYRKTSVLNINSPSLHLDSLNNNALSDVASHLHKLTNTDGNLALILNNFSHSDRHFTSVNVWNASFVQGLISPHETTRNKQQRLDSTEPGKFSDHVPVEDPTPYSTGRGKHGSEERCPDVFPSTNPSGSSSSKSVTLHESDLHRGGTDTPQFLAESGADNKGGSEMLSEVGATVGFCGKACDSSSVEVYLSSDQIKQSYPEIYDRPCYRDACDSGLISPEISVSTLPDSFLVEKCAERGTLRFEKLCEPISSPAFIYLPKTDSENDEMKAAEKSLEREILLFDEFCSSEYSTKVLGPPFLPEVDTKSKSNMVNGYLVDNSRDLVTSPSDTLENSITSFTNGYHLENCVQGEISIELNDVCLPTSGSNRSVQNHSISEIHADIVQMNTAGGNVETNGVVFEGVRNKIKLFESGSPDTFVDSSANKNSSEDSSVSLRRKSFEKGKISMIPSLKKGPSSTANERQPRSSKQESKQTKVGTQSSFDSSPEKSKFETVNEFHYPLSPATLSFEKDLVNQENLSTKSDYKLPSDFCAESEPVNVLDHFATQLSSATAKLAERCKSEELLTSHRRFQAVPKPPEVQESHPKLPNHRHSSADAYFDEIAHKSGKICDTWPTAGLASSVDLLIENESSCPEVRSSNVILDEVRGVQGQSDCGLQARCASLPLVIGQVRTTSPLNYARRNCPMRDGSRGKSRIPRKQTGVRSLHTKPVRPPMWLSKAELTQEIQRLGSLCEVRTKELNRLKMETKHVSVGFDAFASLFKYMVEDLNALSVPMLSEDLQKTLKQLELAKQDLAYYEREVEEMKAHHCQELNDLSNKLFEVFHGEVTELSAKHQEEMNRLQSDHQKQIENLSTTFNATSEEVLEKHEALVSRLQQELISQREELQLFQEREIMDLEEKHTQSTKTLQEHIEQLQKKCAELQHHSMGMEDAMRKDTDTKLQWVTSRKVDLEKEVESLKAVLEMKNKELHTIRVQNLEMEKQLEELPLAREKIKMLQARAEDLEALMIEKTKLERRLSTENQQIRDTYEKESKVNKRLSMENEELQWRIRQAEQSLIAGSFSDVLEYPEDVENGSISPAKSPAPQMMSRSVFFTFMDKEDPSSSPRSQYKKITPGFLANYKTSPGKSARSPPIPSPRRPKSQSEPPQPHVLSSSTPRKVPKQNSLKQKSAQKRQRSGSDCGKPTGEHAEVAFLSVTGSMTSSVSSESSVFGERLLEEHKEQILESLEILREQRSTEGDWCSEDGKTNEDSPPNLEGEDMSRSSEFSDPKTYYHMTFPVLKEAGMPDCDISTAAQAIHSTPDSSSPVGSDNTQTFPLQEVGVPGHQAADNKPKPENNLKTSHSVDDIPERGKKSKEQDRWRTI